MSSFTKKGLREANYSINKATKEHVKEFYKIIKDIN